jgi:phosphohistidine phosphatase
VDIVLLRHGDVEPISDHDNHRVLTPNGRRQALDIGHRLRWYDCSFDCVVVSPLVRAQQTADIVAGIHGDVAAVYVDDRLLPSASASDVSALLVSWLGRYSSVLVVSHQPTLLLLARTLFADSGDVRPFARAEAMRIVDGKLRWRFGHDDEAPRRP